jgi:hypothetical protein
MVGMSESKPNETQLYLEFSWRYILPVSSAGKDWRGEWLAAQPLCDAFSPGPGPPAIHHANPFQRTKQVECSAKRIPDGHSPVMYSSTVLHAVAQNTA